MSNAISFANFSFNPIFFATAKMSSKEGFFPSPFIVVACLEILMTLKQTKKNQSTRLILSIKNRPNLMSIAKVF